ncbi:phage holin family protein [Paenibacillus sp.]|uniref:phage holin family protein n=1 Tax=Paenibacillus sp. TaxID=58172 RepID=UPI0028124557|nr:phage holin family protein [Paenibacillus sp.]
MQRFAQSFNLDSMNRPDNAVVAFFGAYVGPFFDIVYGPERTSVILALYVVILLDWITGIAAARREEAYSSEYGVSGIFRTIFLLAFPALGNVLDHAFGTPGLLFYAVTFGLIYHTYISLTANAARAGWSKYIPQAVLKYVTAEIKAKADRAAGKKGGV